MVKFEKFYPTEDYHQDFVKRNPTHRYVQFESIPRREKTFKKIGQWVKPKE